MLTKHKKQKKKKKNDDNNIVLKKNVNATSIETLIEIPETLIENLKKFIKKVYEINKIVQDFITIKNKKLRKLF